MPTQSYKMSMVSIIAIAQIGVTASPAHAQQVAKKISVATDAAGNGIEEIVVTAQRREESLQKAAIAIDAVSGDDLLQRGITSATALTKAVPALSLANHNGASTSIFIRGVGNITTSSWNDPAVTPSYDGVVLGRGGGVLGSSFYDLQRIEVLKGPQGILYGRNATGGAVNVIPARPEIGHTGGAANFSYGNYDAVDADANVNIGLSDVSALRLAGAYSGHDGYNRDGTDDAKRYSLRGQLLVEPTSDFSVRIGADVTHLGGKGVGGTYLGSFSPDYTLIPSGFDTSEGFNTPAANAYRQTLIGAPGFGFYRSLNAEPSQDITYWGVNAEINWQTSIGKLTVIPAFRESIEHSVFNGPAFNSGINNEKVSQYSLEGRFSGKISTFDYVVGGFLYNEAINANNEYNQEFVLPIQRYKHKTDSWAVFGQLTAHVSDRFRLIGGARYTQDKKSINGLINNFITFCGGAPDGVAPELITPPGSFAQGCANADGLPRYPNFLNTTDTIDWLKSNGWISATATDQAGYQLFNLTNGVGQILKTYNPVIDSGTYSRVTWKASVEFDVSPTSLLYATVETGYRAGGFQLTESKTSYKPEFITAYTIGSKNRFFDNRVQLNLEGFLWKYKDQQINYFTVDSSGTLISSSENAGRSTIKGVDADLIVKPLRGTTLSAKVQYLDTNYDNLHLYTASPRDNIGCPFVLTGGTAGGAPVKDFNCSGRPLLFSPKWTVNLGAEQVVALGQTLELVGNIDTAWRDDQWGAFEYLDFERISAYWTTDASLTLRKVGSGMSITGFVRNLENRRRNVAPQSSPLGIAVGHYNAPRTYGVRLSASF